MSELEDVQVELENRPQILALEALYAAVCASMGEAVEQPFGRREKSRQMGAKPRIVWAPGDEAGNLGAVKPAREPGRNPRPLATLRELFHVQITGFDAEPTRADREDAQYHAARLLYDAWYRAVHYAAVGTFELVSQRWITTKNESGFGLSLLVVGAIQAMIPDESEPEVPADAVTTDFGMGIVDVTEDGPETPLQVAEHQVTPEPPPP